MRDGALRLLFLLLFPLASCASQYYVSPTGNDANSGTLLAPWLTGNHAQAIVHPGDTVYFRSGKYTNMAIQTTAGTSGSPITFKAYPGERPLIQSLTNGSAHAIGLSKNYYILDGFSTSGGLAGIGLYNSSFSIIQNCDVHDSYGNGISVAFNGATNNIIRNCRVYNTTLMNWPRTYTNGWGGGISIASGAHGCLVENCVAYFIHGEGILVGGVNRGTIRNCIVSDTFRTHLYSNGGDNLLEGNIVYSTRANEVDLNNNVLETSIEVTDEGDASTYIYGAIGERGNRVVNNLAISGGGTVLSMNVQDYYPTNYMWSDCFVGNNTLVGGGSEIVLNDPYGTNGFGNNLHIVNNLVLKAGSAALVSARPVIGTNTIDIGNNLYLFYPVGTFVKWDTNSAYWHTASTASNWMLWSGETNVGPRASTWITDTNAATNIIANVFQSAAALPRMWATNGGPVPEINMDAIFADLSTCSNKIAALRQQLAAPFRPINIATNPVIGSGRQFPTWTYVNDYGVTNTVAPITTDLLGNVRFGNPTLGALEPRPKGLQPPSDLRVLSPGP